MPVFQEWEDGKDPARDWKSSAQKRTDGKSESVRPSEDGVSRREQSGKSRTKKRSLMILTKTLRVGWHGHRTQQFVDNGHG